MKTRAMMNRKKIKWKIIAAMDERRVIGREERLPWRIPEDIAWYQSQTDGQLLLMGRKTFESIRRRPEGSRYIILSRTLDEKAFDAESVTIIRSIDELASLALEGEGWVCGGGMLYEEMLHQCDEMYLTEVDGEHEGDTHFPEFHHLFQYEKLMLSGEGFEVKKYVKRE